jgi:hypothetical protein
MHIQILKLCYTMLIKLMFPQAYVFLLETDKKRRIFS